jgi:hypothetical protein
VVVAYSMWQAQADETGWANGQVLRANGGEA